jgi:hypothetical protein
MKFCPPRLLRIVATALALSAPTAATAADG